MIQKFRKTKYILSYCLFYYYYYELRIPKFIVNKKFFFPFEYNSNVTMYATENPSTTKIKKIVVVENLKNIK